MLIDFKSQILKIFLLFFRLAKRASVFISIGTGGVGSGGVGGTGGVGGVWPVKI